MARKVILDVDPGIDDAVALCLALFDPRLDIVAVTAVGGNVPPDQATRNVQAVVEQLDPPRWPRLGAASWPGGPLPADTRHIFGCDGMGNANFEVAELHHLHPSEKVIADEIRAAHDDVTIVALGPLTNVANVFRREPGLASQVGQLIISGGTLEGPGNVTPAAEFNFYCDPNSAHSVIRSPCTKTLIPLDVARQVTFSLDLLDQLPSAVSRAGRFLRRILPSSFRAHRERLGQESILINDAVALAAAVHPELFQTEPMAGDVEISGDLTSGATVFDRRPTREWRDNMEVATWTDPAAVRDYIIRGLAEAGRAG